MYATDKTRWRTRLFFMVVGLFFSGAVYVLITGAIDPAYYQNNGWMGSRPARSVTPESTDKIQLPRDVATPVGKLQLMYKGKQGGDLLIDVLIPELDQHFFYHHAIPFQVAKGGFRLAGQNFVLEMARHTSARLRLVSGK